MKKFLLSLAMLVACTESVKAQKEDNHFGFKAGASLTNFTNAGPISFDYLVGYHAGFVANIDLNDRLSIQPELLYSTKGAKVTVGNITSKQRLDYVELPILLKLKFSQFFVEAGPQAGALVRAKVKYEGGSTTQEENNKNDFSTLELGYAAGLGYQMETGLMLGLRYNGAFTNLAATTSNAATQTQSRNNGFQVYVGYTFNHK